MADYKDNDGRGLQAVAAVLTPGLKDASDFVLAAATGANAVLAPQIGGAAGRRVWITGFQVDGLGATAASVIEVQLANIGATLLRFKLSIPAGATTALAAPLRIAFAMPLPADSLALPIALTVPAFGAGNTSAVAFLYGYTTP